MQTKIITRNRERKTEEEDTKRDREKRTDMFKQHWIYRSSKPAKTCLMNLAHLIEIYDFAHINANRKRKEKEMKYRKKKQQINTTFYYPFEKNL